MLAFKKKSQETQFHHDVLFIDQAKGEHIHNNINNKYSTFKYFALDTSTRLFTKHSSHRWICVHDTPFAQFCWATVFCVAA